MNFTKKHNIKHIITRGHAGVVERFVRTLKNMMFKRLKHEPDKTWYQIIHEILVTLNYIRKSSAPGLTPAEAREPENLIKVKGYMERRRNDTRKYPPVKVGDFVSLYRKRRNFEKENIGLWSDKKYEVKKIEDIPNVGKLYHLDGHQQPVLRAEILI